MKCNVCGDDNHPEEFGVYRDFGYSSSLDSMSFTFYLCPKHKEEFFKNGLDDDKDFHNDDRIRFENKYFNSKMVSELLDTFVYVPKGYYNHDWDLYTEEEEQKMWETHEGPLEVLSYERIIELGELFDSEYVAKVISEKYPEKENPYAYYNDDHFEILLNALSKEDLVRYIKDNSRRDHFLDYFKDDKNIF